MDVFEKEVAQWKKDTAEKWKHIKKEKIQLKWKSPILSKLEGVYEGEIKDGVPHGLGLYTIEDPKFCRGDSFQGTWVNGVMQGITFQKMGKTLNWFYVVDGKAHGKNILFLGDT